jgi:hypothetical protein
MLVPNFLASEDERAFHLFRRFSYTRPREGLAIEHLLSMALYPALENFRKDVFQ